jgi:hypothetical protein
MVVTVTTVAVFLVVLWIAQRSAVVQGERERCWKSMRQMVQFAWFDERRARTL